MKIKESISYRIFKGCCYVILSLFAIACFYPFWYLLVYSLSDGLLVSSNTGFLLWPKGFTTSAYEAVLRDQTLFTGFRNTFICLLIGVPFGLILTTFGAYFMAQKDLLFQKYIMWYIIATMYISGGTIPLYLAMKSYGMTGNLSVVIIPGAVSFYNMVILRTAFQGVPDGLVESAKMDGASHYVIMAKMLVPLTKGTFAVIAMYRALGIWNSWYWASMTIREKTMLPLQSVLRQMYTYSSSAEEAETVKTKEYATLVVAMIPILMVYPLMQKYFTKGVLIGSVKG